MAETHYLKYYITFYIIFSFMLGLFFNSIGDFNIMEKLPVTNLIANMQSGFFYDIFKIVLLPFIVIDFLVLIVGFIGLTFNVLPTTISVLLLAPIGIFILIDYIIPMIRGN